VAKHILSTTFPRLFFRMKTSNRSNERIWLKMPLATGNLSCTSGTFTLETYIKTLLLGRYMRLNVELGSFSIHPLVHIRDILWRHPATSSLLKTLTEGLLSREWARGSTVANMFKITRRKFVALSNLVERLN